MVALRREEGILDCIATSAHGFEPFNNSQKVCLANGAHVDQQIEFRGGGGSRQPRNLVVAIVEKKVFFFERIFWSARFKVDGRCRSLMSQPQH